MDMEVADIIDGVLFGKSTLFSVYSGTGGGDINEEDFNYIDTDSDYRNVTVRSRSGFVFFF